MKNCIGLIHIIVYIKYIKPCTFFKRLDIEYIELCTFFEDLDIEYKEIFLQIKILYMLNIQNFVHSLENCIR